MLVWLNPTAWRDVLEPVGGGAGDLFTGADTGRAVRGGVGRPMFCPTNAWLCDRADPGTSSIGPREPGALTIFQTSHSVGNGEAANAGSLDQ